MRLAWCISAFCLLAESTAHAKVLDVRDFNGVFSKTEPAKSVSQANAAALTKALQTAKPGDSVVVPADEAGIFWAMGGMYASGLQNVTLTVEGTLRAASGWEGWPRAKNNKGNYLYFLTLDNAKNIRLSGGGLIHGSGKTWWDRYVIKPLHGKRPKLIFIHNSTDIDVRDLQLVNSPSFHLQMQDCARVEIANVNVTVDRKWLPVFDTKLQPEDLNTDGFDLSGRDFWVHDCTIRNDDDSIAIKPCGPAKCSQSKCTENILIENMRLIGFGASIGSVPPSKIPPGETYGYCVRNITFRNIDMPGTGKGVYVKSNPECPADGSANAIIQDITYEDIKIDKPVWWAIWIGPQQQHEPGQALGRKCALTYPIKDHCPTQGCVTFKNITLRRITVTDPMMSPGVLLGNASSVMDVTFDDVKFKYSKNWLKGQFPFGRHLKCEHVDLKISKHSSHTPTCGQELEVVV